MPPDPGDDDMKTRLAVLVILPATAARPSEHQIETPAEPPPAPVEAVPDFTCEWSGKWWGGTWRQQPLNLGSGCVYWRTSDGGAQTPCDITVRQDGKLEIKLGGKSF